MKLISMLGLLFSACCGIACAYYGSTFYGIIAAALTLTWAIAYLYEEFETANENEEEN